LCYKITDEHLEEHIEPCPGNGGEQPRPPPNATQRSQDINEKSRDLG